MSHFEVHFFLELHYVTMLSVRFVCGFCSFVRWFGWFVGLFIRSVGLFFFHLFPQSVSPFVPVHWLLRVLVRADKVNFAVFQLISHEDWIKHD